MLALDAHGIPDPSEHVCDGVSQHILQFLNLLAIFNEFPVYQLAFRTPGIAPWSASFLKQMRQMPNLRYTARGRPHNLQRRRSRVVNLGVSLDLAILDLLATWVLPSQALLCKKL